MTRSPEDLVAYPRWQVSEDRATELDPQRW